MLHYNFIFVKFFRKNDVTRLIYYRGLCLLSQGLSPNRIECPLILGPRGYSLSYAALLAAILLLFLIGSINLEFQLKVVKT